MSVLYGEQQRVLQRQFDTERLADRIEERLFRTALTDEAGMLFIDFATPKRLRVNGTARLEPADFAQPAYAEAQFVVVVTVREAFPNCPRYIHKQAPVESSKFVPRSGCDTPLAGWKQMDWARDVLAKDDPARSNS